MRLWDCEIVLCVGGYEPGKRPRPSPSFPSTTLTIWLLALQDTHPSSQIQNLDPSIHSAPLHSPTTFPPKDKTRETTNVCSPLGFKYFAVHTHSPSTVNHQTDKKDRDKSYAFNLHLRKAPTIACYPTHAPHIESLQSNESEHRSYPSITRSSGSPPYPSLSHGRASL
jgi:hypothetical protein